MSTSESMIPVSEAAPNGAGQQRFSTRRRKRSLSGLVGGVKKAFAFVANASIRTDGSDESAEHKRTIGGFIISVMVHLVLLLMMACVVLPHKNVDDLLTIFANEVPQNEGPGEGDGPVDGFEIGLPGIDDQELPSLETNAADVADDTKPQIALDINDRAPSLPPEAVSSKGAGVPINIGTAYGGRTGGGRAAMVRAGGGSAKSEAAVELGLEWLREHQQSDGSWSFDHRVSSACERDCGQPGVLSDCHTGATAMACLAFLGAGHTPEQGRYRNEVRRGVAYLIRNMAVGNEGGDLQGEANYRSMYVHGLAAIALCEAHAMTQNQGPTAQSTKWLQEENKANSEEDDKKEPDKREAKAAGKKGRISRRTDAARNPRPRRTQRTANLSLPQAAQYAIEFIESAQDPAGGGWRYVPRMQGDTSVVGWQLMALESARAGNLKTQPRVFEKVRYFLDSVQSQRGSQYGYMSPSMGEHSTTAIGLLCRMYLGWGRDNPALRQGVEVLSETGPDFDDMYYNYYATQVLHHWGGDHWKKWNLVMRDHLIDTQVKKGHAAGSWDVADRHGTMGGRLYMTCLSIMTLEVYYRHLPLYQSEKLRNGL